MVRQEGIERVGNTTLCKIEDLFFKCEFENPTGSVKDRASIVQFAKLKEKGIKKAVISTSGNAGISAAAYAQMTGIFLTIFVSNKINKHKLKKIKSYSCQIRMSNKPLSESVKFAKKYRAYNLRQSKDSNAIVGYKEIAFELNEQVPEIDAIFIPVSSGTILTGIANGFLLLRKKVAIHAVQTERIHPIASLFDKKFISQNESLADAIVARWTPRKNEVIEIIKRTNGWGWVISDQEMKKGMRWLLGHNLKCSYEGAAALAAYWKSKDIGYNYKNPVCLLSGSFY